MTMELLAFLNIVSLPKKLNEIIYTMSQNYLDLFALNETRLSPAITNNMINIPGYDIVRNDRSRNGGGVCIYLRSSLNYQIRHDIVPTDFEAVCIEITKPHSRPFVVVSVYRTPNASPEFFTHFENLIQTIDNENKKICMIQIS